MEKREKELHPVTIAATLREVMDDLAKTLSGMGPALAFGSGVSTHVPEPISVVVSTSGSTGAAKEVGLTASALLSSARAANKFLGARFGDTWSLLLPLNHIAGINVLIRSLELGTTPIDLRVDLPITKTYPKADFTAIVPTQLFRALHAKKDGDDKLLSHLRSCKAVLVGGAALSEQLRIQARAAGINLVTTYGMTETCGGCVYDGRPLEGVEVQIRDGLIAIKGPVVAGIELTDGWFLTSDLGRYESGVLTVNGRVDDLIISGGEKVSLSAVEEILNTNFTENTFAAFTMNSEEWGASLHIAIAGKHAISNDSISLLLANTLGAAAKPKGFLRLGAIPLLGIGKVDRQALIEFATNEKGRA